MYLESSKMLDVIKAIFEHENLPYTVIEDIGVIMRHKRGCINPLKAVGVYVCPNDPTLCTIITDFYEAVNFIKTKGLTQC